MARGRVFVVFKLENYYFNYIFVVRCYLFDDRANIITDPDFLTANDLDERRFKDLILYLYILIFLILMFLCFIYNLKIYYFSKLFDLLVFNLSKILLIHFFKNLYKPFHTTLPDTKGLRWG